MAVPRTRDPDAGQTIVVQGVRAGTATSVSNVGTSGVGTEVQGLYGKVVINADGSYTYTLDNSLPAVNGLKPGQTLTDTFSYAINDSQGINRTTDWSTLTITIDGRNDPPVAVDDTNTLDENTASVSGDVRGNDSDPDNSLSELSITGVRTGNEGAGGTMESIATGTTSANGTSIQGKYGTLTLGANGTYIYVLDRTHPAVNGLQDGQSLTDEVFTYTLADPDGSTDTAILTITITGVTDGPPSIVADDANGTATGHNTVYEKGLTSVSDTSETASGTITVTAPDGIRSVTIGGVEFTVDELNTLPTNDPKRYIDTGEGILYIAGITVVAGDATAPTEAEVDYLYTLKARQDHSGGLSESTDDISLRVTDLGNVNSAPGTLTIQIIDDTPAAVADTGTVTEGATLTGDVLGNDAAGADGWAPAGAVVGVVAGNSGTPATGGVATGITGAYGTLTLNADGGYSYVATANGITADAVDVFTYTGQMPTATKSPPR